MVMYSVIKTGGKQYLIHEGMGVTVDLMDTEKGKKVELETMLKFDDEGNGVLHATVIYCQRGKMIRFDGPLGLSGRAVQIVTTYEFSEVGQDSTLMKVSVHGSGEMEEGMPAIVEKVWEHFIYERFKPYIESGKHLK